MATHILYPPAEHCAGNTAWYLAARGHRFRGCRVWRYQFVAQRVATCAMRSAPGRLVPDIRQFAEGACPCPAT
jgi:hypothetical protein